MAQQNEAPAVAEERHLTVSFKRGMKIIGQVSGGDFEHHVRRLLCGQAWYALFSPEEENDSDCQKDLLPLLDKFCGHADHSTVKA
jgi:hypothetical protein